MSTDPAWFYSTLAQSSAAIVGLIGGVLGSRMLGHLEHLARVRELLIALVRELQREWSSRRRQIEDLELKWKNARAQAASLQADNTGYCSVNRPIGWIGEPIARPSRRVRPTEFTAEADGVLALLSTLGRVYEDPSGGIETTDLGERVRHLKELMESPLISNRSIHNEDLLKIRRVTEQLIKYREALIPRPFPHVQIVLAWLTVTGVVGPLLFLPALADGWSKVALLAAFVVGIVGLMWSFQTQLAQLRQMGQLRWLTPQEWYKEE